MTKLGDAYEKVNNTKYPRFQFFAITVISLTLITNGGTPLFLTFLTSTKGWTCLTDQCNSSLSLCEQNLTDDDWYTPVSNATDRFVKQYHVYCGFDEYFSMVSSGFFVGFMIGILIGGKLMDKFGRHKVIWIGLFTFCFVVIMHAGSKTDIRVFAVAHVLTGLLSGIIGAIYVYQSELTIGRLRNIGAQVHNETYSIGMLYGALLCYYLEDFRLICIALVVPGLLFGLIIAVWLPESPFWLQVNGRDREVRDGLEYVAKFNNVKFLKDERIDPLENKNKKDYSVFAMFVFSSSTRRTIIIFLFSWLTASYCYWGLSFNVGDLIGNLYVNQVIICTLDLINRPINYYGVRVMNRVTFLRACNVGMAMSAVICMSPYKDEVFPGFNIPKISAIAGRMIADLYFSTVYLYTSEVLPTSVRALGLGICSSTARIGSILAPFVQIANKVSPNINFITILFASFICFICYRWMPETNGKLLPGTLGDMDDLVNGKVRSNLVEMRAPDRFRLLDSESDDDYEFVKEVRS